MVNPPCSEKATLSLSLERDNHLPDYSKIEPCGYPRPTRTCGEKEEKESQQKTLFSQIP